MSPFRFSILVILSITGALPICADSYTFTEIQPPPRTNSVTVDTYANGINDAGTVVGFAVYENPSDNGGYVYRDGVFASVPNGGQAGAINNQGTILSFGYQDAYVTNGSVTTTLHIEGFIRPTGISDSGLITANLSGYIGGTYPYLYTNGSFTALDFSAGIDEAVDGISNSGIVIGTYSKDSTGTEQIYEYQNGKLTDVNIPIDNAVPYGINNAGEIVGGYYGNPFASDGFLYANGTLSLIDDPGCQATVFRGINDKGQIVGSCTESNYDMVGFLADPTPTPEPTPLALAAIGVLGIGLAYRAAFQP